MVLKDPDKTIQALRRKLDAYTNEKLEKGLNMNQRTVYRLRQGRPVKQDTIDRLVAILGGKVGDIAIPTDEAES